MERIGICFPHMDFDVMPFDDIKKYLLKFKKAGVNSFDFYTYLFLNYNEKLKNLVLFLNDNDIKITFHYHSYDNIELIKTPKDYEKLLNNFKEELSIVRQNLKKLNVNYKISIVFHALNYLKVSRKYNHEQHLIEVFSKLSEYSKELNFEILIETLSYNHPNGYHIGDDISEIEVFLKSINSDNFGVCWDIGHTRLNNIENNASLYLPSNIINRVKFTHIHNIYFDKNNICYVDHIPFTNMDYQEEELEYLIKNNYQGIYSIEFGTDNLKENILVYIKSIKILKETLKKLRRK